MPRVPLDDYPTRPVLARALLARMKKMGYGNYGTILEPCAGTGQLIRPFYPHANQIITNDINKEYRTDYHYDARENELWRSTKRPDWIISNPPFSDATRILMHALSTALVGVAFLLRLSFLEPVGKTKRSRSDLPRADVLDAYSHILRYIFVIGSPRPKFKAGSGHDSVTTAWFVWDKANSWSAWNLNAPIQFIFDWKDTDKYGWPKEK